VPAGEDGVAGVVAALIARHDGKVRREEIHNLALAFVSPLSAENREIHDERRCEVESVNGYISIRAPTVHGKVALAIGAPPSADD
jgi:hypothetical protein